VRIYAEYLELVFVSMVALAALCPFLFLGDPGYRDYVLPAAVIGMATYYLVKRPIRKYCHGLILKGSESFSITPRISGATSEYLVDQFDKEILKIVNESRGNRGDYLSLLPQFALFVTEKEAVERLARLRSLGFITANASGVILTPTGMELASIPTLAPQAMLPGTFAAALAKARMEYDRRNFNGATDEVNKLLENVLRAKLEEKYGDSLDSEWSRLLFEGVVKRPYDQANLGILLPACRSLEIIKAGSIYDSILGVFLKLRAPEKHSTGIETDSEKDAKSALELAQIFTRYWFAQ